MLNGVYQILLVEDNPLDVSFVQATLAKHEPECNLCAIADGSEVIDHLNSLDDDHTTPLLDLVILDLHLPKHDGMEVLRKLRSTSRNSRVPVIMTTSWLSRQDQARISLHPPIAHFQKSSDPNSSVHFANLVHGLLLPRKQVANQQAAKKSAGGSKAS
jgi:CheY-like chemotaxis protein